MCLQFYVFETGMNLFQGLHVLAILLTVQVNISGLHRIQKLDAFRIFLDQIDTLLRAMLQLGTGNQISYFCNSTLYFESLLEASNQSGVVTQLLQ